MEIVILGGGDMAEIIKSCLTDYNTRIISHKDCDIRDYNKVKEHIEGFNIVIQTAGSIKPQPILNSNREDWIRDLEVSAIGTYNILSQFNGKIIIVGSSAAKNWKANWSGYSCGKSSQNILVQTSILEGQDAWIIHPGRTNTKMRNRLFPDEDKSLLMNCQQVASKVREIVVGQETNRIIWMTRDETVYS